MVINESTKRGRPRASWEAALCAKRHKGLTVHIGPKNLRLDDGSHWVKFGTNRQRWKLPQYKEYTQFKCMKWGSLVPDKR